MELGKYILYEELGRGAYGAVYRALDTTLRVERAVKVFHPVLVADIDFIERFKREAQTAARLEHPHIVPVYDVGEQDGRYYLAMKYMAGGSLKEKLEKGGRLPYQTALDLVCQIGGALEKAHKEGLVHRDVKPGNILLEEDGAARLADFGFARAMQAASSITLTATGGLAGTPAYMAPELWYGKDAGPATDLYSLACVFYEMLLGEALFAGTQPEVMRQHIMERPQFPKWWPQGVPDGIEDVFKRALAKETGERYANIREFFDRLQEPGKRRRKVYTYQKEVIDATKGERPWKKCEECGKFYDPSFTSCPSCSIEKLEGKSELQTLKKPISGIGSPLFWKAAYDKAKHFLGITKTTKVWEVDGMEMVYVPSGEFLIGSEDNDEGAEEDEKPQHRVFLDSYWIDKYAVTNAMFAKFIQETAYEPQGWNDWRHPRGTNSSIKGLENYPVVNITWYDAITYCQWTGKRLPTEAEWEKAARGTDGHRYPWGNETPSGKLANYAGGNEYKETSPVGFYPSGVSPYGALDMVGNVWEWVNDWYDKDYYKLSPFYNPKGPSDGNYRVFRGGSWAHNDAHARCSIRCKYYPGLRSNCVGFRCAL